MRRMGSGCIGAAFILSSVAAVLAQPAWYAAGTGGFNPNVPDFYQHQNWLPGGTNGWETFDGVNAVGPLNAVQGWCGVVAYCDVFYDLTTQGYAGLFNTDPTTNPWYNAMYGADATAASVAASNIDRVERGTGANLTTPFPVQRYLNNTVNRGRQMAPGGGRLPQVSSQRYALNPRTAEVQYFLYQQRRYVRAADTVFDFTNRLVRNESEIVCQLNSTGPEQNPANGQGIWWVNHGIAVAGVDVANSAVLFADPDSNNGGARVNAGWPAANANFPGNPPANNPPNGSYGLRTPRLTNDNPPQLTPLPVPNAPALANAATYNRFYAAMTFTNQRLVPNGPMLAVAASNDAQLFNGTWVGAINAITPISPQIRQVTIKPASSAGLDEVTSSPSAVAPRSVRAQAAVPAVPAPPPDEVDTSILLEMPLHSPPVDALVLVPSTNPLDPLTHPGADTLTIAQDPTSLWSASFTAADPFGNPLDGGAIRYDLLSGSALLAAEDATLTIATDADFSSTGYNLILHYQGEPESAWLPFMIGQTPEFDPSDTFFFDQVPEPGSLVCGVMVLPLLGGRGWRRKRATAPHVADVRR